VLAEWLPQIRRLLGDGEPRVRAAAMQAIGAISNQDAAALAHSMLADRDARIRATAAMVLAGSGSADDVTLAETTLLDLSSDASEHGRAARREVAAAVREIANPRFRRLLVPLLSDPAPDVADVAMQSVQAIGVADVLFVPTLVALLRHRQLKVRARDVLVSFGEPVVEPLAYILHDQDEDVWVRRHIPGTLACIACQRSVDVLVTALSDPDGLLRFNVAHTTCLLHASPAVMVEHVARILLSQFAFELESARQDSRSTGRGEGRTTYRNRSACKGRNPGSIGKWPHGRSESRWGSHPAGC
jgi:HEAT repeat protein